MAPRLTTQVVARDKYAGKTDQAREDADWLVRQQGAAAPLGQLARLQIQREIAEAYDVLIVRNSRHT